MSDDPKPKTVESHVRSQIIMAQPVVGAPFVFVQFEIDCPVCGEQLIQISGHHLRLIRDVIIEAIDKYPALTQVAGTVVLDTLTIKGPGNKASDN